jgi:hypothetical protein
MSHVRFSVLHQSEIRRLIPEIFNLHCGAEGPKKNPSAKGLSDRVSPSGCGHGASRAKPAAPRESRAESSAIPARLAAVRGRPAGARSAASWTAGPSLPPLRLFSANLWSGPSSPCESVPFKQPLVLLTAP